MQKYNKQRQIMSEIVTGIFLKKVKKRKERMGKISIKIFLKNKLKN